MDGGQGPNAVPERGEQEGAHVAPQVHDDDLQLGDFPGEVLFHAHMDWREHDEPQEDEEPAEMQGIDDPGPGRAFAERHVRLWNARGNRALPQFVRMLLPLQGDGGSNEQLVRRLKRKSAITEKNVQRAFQVCARDIFLPPDQKVHAFGDHPVPLDGDFNVSAPHMHATMVEGLQVKRGDRVLDIGAGCGVTSALLAFLAGKTGSVVGVELRSAPLALARSSMAAMLEHKEYAQQAADVALEQGNAFILPHHEGAFDRVHVGALCAPDKLPALLALLKPSGGRVVVPCGAELLALTVDAAGAVARDCLATVKFGALETPSDAAIVLGHLSLHRAARLAAPASAPRGGGASSTPGSSSSDDDDELDVASVACSCGPRPFARRAASLAASSFAASFASSSASSGRGIAAAAASLGSASPTGRASFSSATSASPRPAPPPAPPPPPPPDCVVRGAGFELPARTAVLAESSAVLAAQLRSGMADASAAVVTLPPDVAEPAARLALQFLHTGAAAVDEESALPTLAVANYLAAAPLASHCTAALIAHLRRLPTAAAVDAAAQLHVYAAEHGVEPLASFCAGFLAVHYAEARAAPSFALLAAPQLAEILEAMAGERALLLARLGALAAPPPPFAAAAAAPRDDDLW